MNVEDYLPKPKVVAAFVTVAGVAVLALVLELIGVEQADLEGLSRFVLGGGLAVGAAYMKPEN